MRRVSVGLTIIAGHRESMEKDFASHAGLVVKAGKDCLYVKLLSVNDNRQCASCAMSFACSNNEDVMIEAVVPEGVEPEAMVGKKVTVEMLPHTARRATLLLLLLPLAVFLVVASLGTVFRLEAGLTGVMSIGAAALSYFFIARSTSARKPGWRLVEDVGSRNMM